MKKFRTLILLLGLALTTCSEDDLGADIPIWQYADFVIDYSSQYTTTRWAATRALGKENVYPNHGDYDQAWSPFTADDSREFLELGFDSIQTVRVIEIYETYNPGAIDTVYLRNAETQEWKLVYGRTAVVLPLEARKFGIYFTETDYFVDAIRIEVNSPEVPSWNEIDAVAISGFRRPGEGD